MAENLTPKQILAKADQVISYERALSSPNMLYAFDILKTYLEGKTREKDEKLTSLIGELEDAAFYCGDHRPTDEKPYSELYEDLWEARDAIKKHLENKDT